MYKLAMGVGMMLLWGVMAAVGAGPVGLGVVFSGGALADIATGSFKGNNKIVWTAWMLFALLFAVIGMAYRNPSDGLTDNPVYVMAAAGAILLPLIYLLVGRRQRIPPAK